MLRIWPGVVSSAADTSHGDVPAAKKEKTGEQIASHLLTGDILRRGLLLPLTG